jgi:hypothetical protein
MYFREDCPGNLNVFSQIGATVPLFRHIDGRFVCTGNVEIVGVEVVSSESDEVKNSLEMEIQGGGWHAKEPYWFKLILRPVVADPMGVVPETSDH